MTVLSFLFVKIKMSCLYFFSLKNEKKKRILKSY